MSIECRFQSDKLLSSLSTFGIGGPIRYYLEAKTSSDMIDAILWAKEKDVPYFILGKGSNSLFDDRGFSGLVIHNKIDVIHYDGFLVSAGAGSSFSLLGIQTAKRGLTGLEFASGIPGSVGGAVFMNAGANGRETCQALLEVDYLKEDGKQIVLKRDDMAFSYRHSSFQTMRGCILAARFLLEAGASARINQLSILSARMKSQPLKDKSAGCIFRNPACGGSAGALIDRCGLKGYSIGGAQISPVHANFIVNVSCAKAEDVLALICEVQRRVFDLTQIWLEPEVRQIPYEP